MQSDSNRIQLVANGVDYELRRRQIARVVARLWATRGERVCTIRAVAHELGTSVTVVTRAFASREEMMRFTREFVMDEWAASTAEAVAAQSAPADKLRALLIAQCPVDEWTLLQASLWLQSLAPQHRDEDLINANERFNESLLELAYPLLEVLGVDRHAAPLLLVAVAYGLNAAAVEDPETWTFERVEQAVDEILRRFGVAGNDSVGA